MFIYVCVCVCFGFFLYCNNVGYTCYFLVIVFVWCLLLCLFIVLVWLKGVDTVGFLCLVMVYLIACCLLDLFVSFELCVLVLFSCCWVSCGCLLAVIGNFGY